MNERGLLDSALSGDRLELIAAVLVRAGDPRPLVLLPLRVLRTDGSLTSRIVASGLDLDPYTGAQLRPGSVIHFLRSPDGTVTIHPRYHDALEFLDPREPAQVLLNALWTLHEHGVASDDDLPRAQRLVARLLSHPEPQVQSEARHVGEALTGP